MTRAIDLATGGGAVLICWIFVLIGFPLYQQFEASLPRFTSPIPSMLVLNDGEVSGFITIKKLRKCEFAQSRPAYIAFYSGGNGPMESATADILVGQERRPLRSRTVLAPGETRRIGPFFFSVPAGMRGKPNVWFQLKVVCDPGTGLRTYPIEPKVLLPLADGPIVVP